MNETPSYVYVLLWGGVALLALVIVGGIAGSRLTRWFGLRTTRRAVADKDVCAIRLKALRDTPDSLMTRELWAELTHLEFDAHGLPVSLGQAEIARANIGAALNAFCRTSGITPRALRRYAEAIADREEIARAEREAYVFDSWSDRLVKAAGGDLEAAREQWTGIPADLGKTQEWPTVQPRELVSA